MKGRKGKVNGAQAAVHLREGPKQRVRKGEDIGQRVGHWVRWRKGHKAGLRLRARGRKSSYRPNPRVWQRQGEGRAS